MPWELRIPRLLEAAGRTASVVGRLSWPLVLASSPGPGMSALSMLLCVPSFSWGWWGLCLLGNLKVAGQLSGRKGTENHREEMPCCRESQVRTCSHSGPTCGICSNVPSHWNDRSSLANPRVPSHPTDIFSCNQSMYFLLSFSFLHQEGKRKQPFWDEAGCRFVFSNWYSWKPCLLTKGFCGQMSLGKHYKFCSPLGQWACYRLWHVLQR